VHSCSRSIGLNEWAGGVNVKESWHWKKLVVTVESSASFLLYKIFSIRRFTIFILLDTDLWHQSYMKE